MVALVVVVFAQVALRYLTYQPLAWTEELARYVFLWLSLLGAAVGGRRGTHFAVDLVPRRLRGKSGRALRAGIHLAEIGFYIVLTLAGARLVRIVHLQYSPTLGLPMSAAYAAIPTAAALLTIYNARLVVRELRAAHR